MYPKSSYTIMDPVSAALPQNLCCNFDSKSFYFLTTSRRLHYMRKWKITLENNFYLNRCVCWKMERRWLGLGLWKMNATVRLITNPPVICHSQTEYSTEAQSCSSIFLWLEDVVVDYVGFSKLIMLGFIGFLFILYKRE